MKKHIEATEIHNKRAYWYYYFEDTLECGIELKGNEVKSIRSGMVNIKDAYASIENGELILHKVSITPWSTSNEFDIERDRDIRLLATKQQIRKLKEKVMEDGYTLIPLKMYFNKAGKCKVVIGVGKGQHRYDRRRIEKQREIRKEIIGAQENSNIWF